MLPLDSGEREGSDECMGSSVPPLGVEVDLTRKINSMRAGEFLTVTKGNLRYILLSCFACLFEDSLKMLGHHTLHPALSFYPLCQFLGSTRSVAEQ